LEELAGRKIPFYHVDCTDYRAMQQVFIDCQPEGVIHFAAFKAVGESVEKPLKYYKNNVGGLATMLELMLERGVQNLVFSSSCTVYGQPDQLPATENSPLQEANSPYGYSKQIGERMISETVEANLGKLGAVLLRYFNPIGAHPSGLIGELPLGIPNNLVPYINQAAAGELKELTVYGNDYDTADGTCVRDYIHVVDLANAHIKALEWISKHQEQCKAFNIGTGKGHSVKEVIDTFEAVNGVKVPHHYGDRRAGDVEQIYASSSLAEKELGWKSERNLADALSDSWNWQMALNDLSWKKDQV